MKNIDIKLGDIQTYRDKSIKAVKRTWDWNIFEVLLYLLGAIMLVWFLTQFDIEIKPQAKALAVGICKPQPVTEVKAESQAREVNEVQGAVAGKVARAEKPSEVQFIVDWINGTVNGSPIDLGYVESLYRASGNDLYLTKLAVAIAYAETTLGTHPSVAGTRHTNWMGWSIYTGYDPESVDEFAGALMPGLENYRGVESSAYLIDLYTGGDSVGTWEYAVNSALEEMGNE